MNNNTVLCACGCGEVITSKKKGVRYIQNHHLTTKEHRSILERKRYDIYETQGDITLIHIVGVGGSIKGVTTIDTSEADQAKKYKWYVKDNGYIASESGGYLHRFLTKCPKNKHVDHINGDRLDNRLFNLRICDQSDNCKNIKARKGKYKGVHKHSTCNSFVAQITHNLKMYHLGSFKTEKEAAIAYNQAALKLHGEYARLNVIEDGGEV